MSVELQRVYDYVKQPPPEDAHVVLVDGLWPRGLSKRQLRGVEWLRQLAPSTELRQWFAHRPSRWEPFKARYREELHCCEKELQQLRTIAAKGKLILLYAARDEAHNQAVALQGIIEAKSGRSI
ncbi:MAG TPA: DUF488 family protein [Gammaproteobacteria bacterium]